FTSTVDDAAAIDALLELDEPARSAGVLLAPGCGLAPGLADVLARHATDALDSVDEIHVARAGAAGPACTAAVRHARRDPAREWRCGAGGARPASRWCTASSTAPPSQPGLSWP